jgi:hypothetical protein
MSRFRDAGQNAIALVLDESVQDQIASSRAGLRTAQAGRGASLRARRFRTRSRPVVPGDFVRERRASTRGQEQRTTKERFHAAQT